MRMLENIQNHSFVLDTCTIINIMKNQGVADLLKCHLDMNQSSVYVNEISLEEASRKGYSKKEIISALQNSMDTLVIVKQVPSETHFKAQELENECSLLHSGDSAIAAFSVDNKSTLITYDKDLLKGCQITGISAISPNMLLGGIIV